MGSAQQNSFTDAGPAAASSNAKVPRGTRVYVIGDIHGCLDLLDQLHKMVQADAAAHPAKRNVLIHLGDYVDRGPDSFGVVERLITLSFGGFETINLKGNHEDFLLRFLSEESAESSVLDVWYMNGCAETLLSYGIDIHGRTDWNIEADTIREQFRKAIPHSHIDFYKTLNLRHIIGDYLFVHAGIQPDMPLDQQKEGDLLWIRDTFIMHPGPFAKVVVHGHTIFPAPDVRHHRIGIDTGAYYSGKLTCLVLEGNDQWLLQT